MTREITTRSLAATDLRSYEASRQGSEDLLNALWREHPKIMIHMRRQAKAKRTAGDTQ